MNSISKIVGLAFVLSAVSTGMASAATLPAPISTIVSDVQHIGGPTTGPVHTGPREAPSAASFFRQELTSFEAYLEGMFALV